MKKFAAFLMIVSVSCFSFVGCKEAEEAAPVDEPAVDAPAEEGDAPAEEGDKPAEETDDAPVAE